MAYVDMDVASLHLRLVSAHLPHEGYDDDSYEVALSALEDAVQIARQMGRNSIVGADANAQVGRRTDADNNRIIGENGLGTRDPRGCSFVAWLHGKNLAALNTIRDQPAEERWTQQMWSNGNRRQIDFILSHHCDLEAVRQVLILDCFDGSDHRGVMAEFTFEVARRSTPVRRQKVCVGWKPKLDAMGAPNKYHNALDDAVDACGGGDRDPTDFIVEAALKSGTGPQRQRHQHSAEIQSLFAARRNESDPEARKQLSKDLWRALRRQRRTRMQNRLAALAQEGAGLRKLKRLQQQERGRQRITHIRDKDGTLQNDPDQVAEIFAAFLRRIVQTW
jgi:hypothetical protein